MGKIIMGDKNMANAENIAKIMNDAGYDAEPVEMDLSSRKSILKLIDTSLGYGEIKRLKCLSIVREFLPVSHR